MKSFKSKSVLFVYSISILILILIKPNIISNMDVDFLGTILILLVFSVFFHFFINKEKNFFRPDTLFILGFLIVHFQWILMIVFSNIMPRYFSLNVFNENIINYSIWVSAIGFIFWLIGYSLVSNPITSYVTYNVNGKILFLFNVVLLLFFLLLAGKSFISGSIYKGNGQISVFAYYIQLILDSAVIVLAAISFIKFRKRYLVFMIIYVCIYLYSGDRGAAIRLLLILLIFYGVRVRPISFKISIVLFLIGGVFLSIIGFYRSGYEFGAGFSSFYSVTIELANSARVLFLSIFDVYQHNELHYGKLWISKFLSVIPFLQSIYIDFSGDLSRNLGSGAYITYVRYGEYSTTGEGTTLISDIYLNFGVYGVCVFMFLLGSLYKKIYISLKDGSNIYFIIVAACLSSFCLYQGRAGLFDMLRMVCWSLVILWLFVLSRWKIR